MHEADKYKTIEISDTGKASIRFLYSTVPGRILLLILIRTTVSKLAGLFLRSPASRIFINGFIKRNNINMEEYRKVKYKSFDDFFTRELKPGGRPISNDNNDVITPCDSKLTVYKLSSESVFDIKNSVYSVNDLLQDEHLAAEFSDGICLIFRLTPDDYHRYIYIDGGEILDKKRIKGVLHTVQPIAYQHLEVFHRNTREYTVIQTENFGKIIQMEVGALFVGKITNHGKAGGQFYVKRGEEKGMFQFGGSTIILLFKKNMIEVDEDIYENTAQNKETILRMGNKIGSKI